MAKQTVVELQEVDKIFTTRHFFQADEETRRRRLYKKSRVYAADKISFTIGEGEIFGLLGPNGAGKTTCVKMVSGLVRPDHGRVLVDGLDVDKKRKQVLRRVGVVLEGTRTSMWPLTPLENLHYYGNLKNVRGRTLKDRAHDLLDFIGLQDKKNVQVRRLSRGQKQKLALCIALIADPNVLLLDEPTTGLDVQSARAIKDRILEMTRQHRRSVLVTTHDMHVAQELCDRIGIIDNGKLVACKRTEELLDLFSEQIFVFRVDRRPEGLNGGMIPGVISLDIEETGEGPQIAACVSPEPALRSEAIYGITELLRGKGLLLRGINQRQQNLESVFLQLTGKGSTGVARPEKG
jgi:ABC-2 type transport system ATP-binding protein